jgi:phage FluMu gp28-like protein
MAVLMWGGKSRVTVISTHNGTENHFNTIVEQIHAGKKPYSLHKITLDDALEQGLYKRICLVNDEPYSKEAEDKWRDDLFAQYGEDAEEELNVVPARSGGTYIGADLIERAMKPGGAVLRLSLPDGFAQWSETARVAHVQAWCSENVFKHTEKLPKDKRHFFGEDFGRTSDRTVIAPGYIAQDLTRVFPFMVEMLNVPYEQQKQVLFYVVDRLPKFFFGALDAGGNGGYLAEVASQKYGEARIEKIMLSEKWYSDNLPKLKAAYEDETIEHPRDADHLTDIGHLKKINGVPKLPKAKTTAGEGPPRHGDAAIALALGHYASRQNQTGSSFVDAMRRVRA